MYDSCSNVSSKLLQEAHVLADVRERDHQQERGADGRAAIAAARTRPIARSHTTNGQRKNLTAMPKPERGAGDGARSR